MKNKGFSLVELIVVIAIMAILVGVAVPVYTSYIEKTQKNKDIQMVDEIKHAIEIAAVGDSWATKLTPGVVGTIVITDQGMTVNGTTITVNGTDVEPLEDALVATFGDLSGLKLSYDGWTGTLASAAGADGVLTGSAVSITNSAYVSDVAGLLDAVQSVTILYKDVASGITEAKPEEFLNEFFGNSSYTDTQAANAMIVYVAENTTENKDLDQTAFVNWWKSNAYSKGTFKSETSGLSMNLYASKGAEYAYVQAVATRLNCHYLNKALAAYNSAYTGSSPISDVLKAHLQNFTADQATDTDADGNVIPCNCQANMKTALTPANLQADAEAYLAVMGQIVNSKDVVAENSHAESMYTDSPITQYVESYISVAQLMASQGVEDGQVVLVVSMDSNGTVTVNAYPIEY